ncbi:4'-phosphopantetheinyl transferase family protein [Azospirillum soli]|uniref:4'-phosphopantetheinyl transferase family protein n=1 Tax=Azospirillum soli TaxID=1304799 RepID=UPI001AE623DD|nr:4'-phosphopantetheinyl transferase superfamily protein [Azospirillum soli]MBP2316210.1 4'-phosphopantetheinyl transferase [Azospirillum soli]
MMKDGEIRVCHADLRTLTGQLEALRPLLSPDEAEHAARYKVAELRDRCVLRRGVLRLMLGRCVGRAPETLAFDYGPQGKPLLPGGPAFNLADCKDDVLMAVAPAADSGVDLGVDIERMRVLPDADGIAGRFFAPAERTAFAAVPEPLRAEAFLNAWTRKEAFIKATGAGLSMPLDQFAVELTPGRPARLLSIDDSLGAGRAEDWSLFDLRRTPDTVAALAVRGTGWRIVTMPVDELLSNGT